MTEEEALKTTRDLIKVLYQPAAADDSAQEDVQGLAKDICEECLKLLREPEKSQATPALKVINAFLTTTRTQQIYSYSISHTNNYEQRRFGSIPLRKWSLSY